MMELERREESEASLEERVDRLETTLKELAREPRPVTLHGPCPGCGECLLFLRGGTMYCPHCGGGQHV